MATIPTIKTRVVQHDVLAIVDIKLARDGVTVDNKTTSSINMPDPDTAAEAWLSLGRGSNFVPVPEEKALTVEEFADDGTPTSHKDYLPMGLSFKFLCSQMSPEAYELMLGIEGPIDDNKPLPIAARGSNTIEGWITLSLLRAQDKSAKVGPIQAHGRLRLSTQPQAQIDYAKPEFEFILDVGNPLNTATMANIQALNAGA